MKPIEFVVTDGDNHNAPAGEVAAALEKDIRVLVTMPSGRVVRATILSYYLPAGGENFVLELETK